MVALRIASRGSELALWQSRAVEAALRAADPSLEVRIDVIRTTGDRIQDVPLAKIGDKGLFTKELDNALLAGDADLAVHSLKDVPTRLPDGLALAAVTVREDPRDVVLLAPGRTGGLDALPSGARVGTSSLRRRAQLQALRPELEVLDLRGNLNTRLAKLDRGDYDAIILAAAGVRRLGWEDRISESLDPGQWLPAVGQGALAVVCCEDRAEVLDRLRALHDPHTAACTTAERALLRALEGGCQVPIGALGRVDGDRLVLDGLVADTDGTCILRVQESGPVDDAQAIGRRAADALLARGAGEVLAAVRARAAAPEPAAP
ncbi:hydroxymethylbilane synthase [Longimicrobium sp.]|uniref:hydroxymethylbilane synthase n=1 Tax=Longimicrobium sp. TaxID=2029185 RepID=UPI002EDAD28D